jgi:hypothetical protein
MTDATSPLPEAARTLLERIEQLEARVASLEQPPRSANDRAHLSSTALGARSEILMAKLRASSEFARQERIEELRRDPSLLAGIRARRAAVNAFFVERGLPPDPEPYPELP